MSNFVLTLPLKTEKFHEDIIENRLEIARKIYNSCLSELIKRRKVMKESKEFRRTIKLPKSKEKNKRLADFNKLYGVTEYSLHTYVKPMQHKYKKNIDSHTAQKIATRAYKAMERLVFGDAEKLSFKRFGEMTSVEGKTNNAGIRFINTSIIAWNGLFIPVVIKKSDTYAQMAIYNKVKYCRIVKKRIRGKNKYYVQLIIEGVPPVKINRETGEIRNKVNSGTVGIDIGTQTIAISSSTEVKLLELAEGCNSIDRTKRVLQRKLDRQRRANNPHKYNEDGTIKRTNEKWIHSKRYLQTKQELAEIQRKLADKRKQSHNILANYILSLGDEVYIETMHFKGLQKRAKKTTFNNDGRINKKKRFGKSLGNKAPSMFVTILANKLRFNGTELNKIDTAKVKASQYSHFDGTYTKKKLGTRWNDFGEMKIQRDMYSAFLLMNMKTLDSIDRSLCFYTFNHFKRLHDIEIGRLRTTKNIASMGI
ncbi:MAG: RNA-guided endonuclease TnpB family protein [Bacilli bacterium]